MSTTNVMKGFTVKLAASALAGALVTMLLMTPWKGPVYNMTCPEAVDMAASSGPIHQHHNGLGGQQTLRNDPRDEQSLPDDHPDLVYVRKYGRVQNLPTDEEMKAMTDKQVLYIYNSYLDNMDLVCGRKLRLGNSGDGGYDICDDYLYRPIKPCLVYSFGIRNEFSFDDTAANLYGCEVFSFDPGMRATFRRSERVMFYKIGLGGSSGKSSSLGRLEGANQQQWEVKTLTQLKAMLGHSNRTIDLLKIDVEGSEWASLEDMIAQGELLKVRQLLMEFHTDFDHPESIRTMLPTLRTLESLGYRRIYNILWANNPSRIKKADIYVSERTCCNILGFVNVRLAKQERHL